MYPSKAKKIELLTKIAAGDLHPKALLPQHSEAWLQRENGNLERNGIELTALELDRYHKKNPHINPFFRIRVKRKRDF